MRSLFRSTLLLPILLGGCSAGERGLNSIHQPTLGAAGAIAPHCPDWSDDRVATTDAQGSNYGCADAVNLAAMIADPNDLVHGKSVRGSDVEVGVRSIRAWREIQPSSKQWQVTPTVSAKSGGN